MTEVRAPASLEAVFREDYAALCRLAAIIVGEAARAEELVMDAVARCLAGRIPEEPHSYLRRAVVNRCRSHSRRRGIEWRANAEHQARTTDTTLPVEPDDAVLQAVRRLPPRQRAAVVLTYYADLAEADVADALGCSVGTVKSQLSKARSALARSLEVPDDPR